MAVPDLREGRDWQKEEFTFARLLGVVANPRGLQIPLMFS